MPYDVFVVGNDVEFDVKPEHGIDYLHWNPDPQEYVMARVYRAWNALLEHCESEWVVLINSDMVVSDHWLDELWVQRDGPGIPTSLLVEPGTVPSAYPEYVRDFGTSPETFDWDGWAAHAASLRQPGHVGTGQLYMPCLLHRETALQVGGYPNQLPGGCPGDIEFFQDRLQQPNRLCFGSICYHCGPFGEAGRVYG